MLPVHRCRYILSSLIEKFILKPLKRSKKRTLLFGRSYRAFTGGQLKIRNYFDHVLLDGKYEPWIYMTRKSNPSLANLWSDKRERIIKNYDYRNADVIFLAGPDWLFLKQSQRFDIDKPKINLIQDFYAIDPHHHWSGFLKYPAIRICVSEELRHALLKTGKVNGPLISIPNGIDLSQFEPQPMNNKPWEIAIFGQKNPSMAISLFESLVRKVPKVKLFTEKIERAELLKQYSLTKIAILLPYKVEGFFLPALEAMASGCIVIVPDCIGNRSFCLHEKNSIVTEYSEEALETAVLAHMRKPETVLAKYQNNALRTAKSHSILNERKLFLNLLANIDTLWQENFHTNGR